MIKPFTLLASISVILALGLSACSTAKLEARLEANPQCKEVINPKTGAVMPCPGTDRAFYVAAGLEAPRPAKVKASAAPDAPATSPTAPVATKQATSDCKPQIHKKTGGMMPCPPDD
jgi:hypothetical protein